MVETWRPVKGWETRYEVSNCGRVRALASKVRPGRHPDKIMKPYLSHDGYLTILLTDGSRKYRTNVHRIMLLAFTDKDCSHLCAAHKNGKKRDNRLPNLYWATNARNNRDKMKHGNMVVGEKHHAAKLTTEDVLEIRRGISIGITYREIGARFGISGPTIWAIKVGKTWRHIDSNRAVEGET